MSDLTECLKELRQIVGKDQLTLGTHLSCFTVARLIQRILLELCAPTFETIFTDQFVPLKEAGYIVTSGSDREVEVQFPDGINGDTLFMRRKMLHKLAITEGEIYCGEWTCPNFGWICTEYLLSREGKLFRMDWVDCRRQDIINEICVDELTFDIYCEEKATENFHVRLVRNIMSTVLKDCSSTHPDLCAQIAEIVSVIDFESEPKEILPRW